MVVASIVGGYLLQSLSPNPDAAVRLLGLTPRALTQGRWWTLASVVIVHGGWAHAILNSLGALAFGAPVARRLGRGGGAILAFLGFYLVCAVVASLGYLALHWGEAQALVGASGAVSGLMGASSRLLDRRDALASFTSRTVLAMAAAWGFTNLLMALGWIDVGAGGAPIAWEAHLFGYAAGLVLIGPLFRLTRKPEAALQPPPL